MPPKYNGGPTRAAAVLRARMIEFGKMKRLGRRLRRGRGQSTDVHHYIRSTQTTGLAFVLTNVAYAPVYTPVFQNLPNYAEFSALYDQYKVKKIVLTFEPTFDGHDLNTGQLTNVPSTVGGLTNSLKCIRYVIDNNDNTAIASASEIFEYSKMKSFSIGKKHSITLYPKVLAEYYRTALSTGYAPRPCPWLACDSSGTAVPFYGIKFYLDPCTTATDLNNNLAIYNVRATWHFACKAVK